MAPHADRDLVSHRNDGVTSGELARVVGRSSRSTTRRMTTSYP